jgi:hypothetical protein
MKQRGALKAVYPTQAKNGLEWGTQPSLPVEQTNSPARDRRDDKGEGSAHRSIQRAFSRHLVALTVDHVCGCR